MKTSNLLDRTRRDIEKLIETSDRTGDTKLPTETQLSDALGVSRNTIRAAIGQLVSEGRVNRIQGKGTFVVRKTSTLRFSSWVPGEIPSHDAFERMVRRFEERYAGHVVSTDVIPYHQYPGRVMRKLNHGRGPDVIQLAPYWLQRFATGGYLRSIDDLISTANLSRRYTKDIESCRIGGETFALNWALAPLVLYYNKTVLRETGLDPGSPPQTLDELYDAARYINRLDRDDVKGICLPLSSYEAYLMWVYPFLLSFGGGLFDAIGNTRVTTPENADALRWLCKLNRDGGFPDGKSITDARILFATNRVAFTIDGPYGRGFFGSIRGTTTELDDWAGVTTIPVGPSGRSESMLLAHSLAISSQCPDPEAAYVWIEHLTTDENNAKDYYERSGMIPAIRDLLHAPEFVKDPFVSVLIRQLETATAASFKHPGFPRIMPFAAAAFTDAILGTREAEERLNVLEEIVTLINHSLQ